MTSSFSDDPAGIIQIPAWCGPHCEVIQPLMAMVTLFALSQSCTFELPLWVSYLFTTCTALLGGRNKPNFLTKLDKVHKSWFTTLSQSPVEDNSTKQFLIQGNTGRDLRLWKFPSNWPLFLSLPSLHYNTIRGARILKRKIQCAVRMHSIVTLWTTFEFGGHANLAGTTQHRVNL